MSDSILFRGCSIRYFDVRQEEGGASTRLHLTADFSTPVMEAMDWTYPGDCVTDAKLEGELHATHFILTPGDKALHSQEIQFDINEATDFKLVAVKDGEDSKHRELRFIVRTSAAGVAAKLDEYIRRVGDHQGALKIAYVKQEQLELEVGTEGPSTGKKAEPEGEEEEADTGCVLCNNDVKLDPKNSSRHINGQKCTRDSSLRVKLTGPDGEVVFEGTGEEFKEAASTLASARELNGGTHARRAKQGVH